MYAPVPSRDTTTAALGRFATLPAELHVDIVARLPRPDLKSLNATSQAFRSLTVPLIWNELNLIDRRRAVEGGASDEHDDTPIIKKLLLLAHDPWLASCVHVVNHSCHLPPPDIFTTAETPFSGQTLSTDARTIALIKIAVRQTINVHTIRIIMGHCNINDALLRCFFDAKRDRTHPVRRLWLENCRISAGCNPSIVAHPHDLPLQLDFTGLQSLRLRRLPLRGELESETQLYGFQWVHSRSAIPGSARDNNGPAGTTSSLVASEYTVANAYHIWQERTDTGERPKQPLPLLQFYKDADTWDQIIYDEITAEVPLPDEVAVLNSMTVEERAIKAFRGVWLDPSVRERETASTNLMLQQREQLPSHDVALSMIGSASSTLTSLTLDWLLYLPENYHRSDDGTFKSLIKLFWNLFNCRFPHLKAFQFRNCIDEHTRIPDNVFLFETTIAPLTHLEAMQPTHNFYAVNPVPFLGGLEFMEAHPNIECLGWPMDRFFSPEPQPTIIEARVNKLLERLSTTLHNLRIDSKLVHSAFGEPPSGEEVIPLADPILSPISLASRRKFLTTVPVHLNSLRVLKMEGGAPHDERREMIRALHRAPLEEIVYISMRSPIGNTWGPKPALQGEDAETFYRLAEVEGLPEIREGWRFEVEYGWEGSAPLVTVAATFHARTVKKLKFCGFVGAPVLWEPGKVAGSCLAGLRYFERLEWLGLGVWLDTVYEEHDRGDELAGFWRARRDPGQKALVVVPREGGEEGEDGDGESRWARDLRTKYEPSALARRVVEYIGPFLNAKAKSRKEGVMVRISFSVGDEGSMFDLDVIIATDEMKRDICLGYEGPREESDPDRKRGKIESRRWF